jgi:hypothetical protein
MSGTELDQFGIVKKFPDLEGGVTIIQDGPEWDVTFTEYGYNSIPGVKIRRKTFKFNKKLKADQEVTTYVLLPRLNSEYSEGIDGIGNAKVGLDIVSNCGAGLIQQ